MKLFTTCTKISKEMHGVSDLNTNCHQTASDIVFLTAEITNKGHVQNTPLRSFVLATMEVHSRLNTHVLLFPI